MSIKLRFELEKRIIAAIVEDAIAKGYRLAVSLNGGWDVDEMLLGSTDVDDIVRECMAGDDSHLFIQPAGMPSVEDGKVVSMGWVYFVLGNDGWDVVSDYTTGLDKLGIMFRAEAIAEEYS